MWSVALDCRPTPSIATLVLSSHHLFPLLLPMYIMSPTYRRNRALDAVKMFTSLDSTHIFSSSIPHFLGSSHIAAPLHLHSEIFRSTCLSVPRKADEHPPAPSISSPNDPGWKFVSYTALFINITSSSTMLTVPQEVKVARASAKAVQSVIARSSVTTSKASPSPPSVVSLVVVVSSVSLLVSSSLPLSYNPFPTIPHPT